MALGSGAITEKIREYNIGRSKKNVVMGSTVEERAEVFLRLLPAMKQSAQRRQRNAGPRAVLANAVARGKIFPGALVSGMVSKVTAKGVLVDFKLSRRQTYTGLIRARDATTGNSLPGRRLLEDTFSTATATECRVLRCELNADRSAVYLEPVEPAKIQAAPKDTARRAERDARDAAKTKIGDAKAIAEETTHTEPGAQGPDRRTTRSQSYQQHRKEAQRLNYMQNL